MVGATTAGVAVGVLAPIAGDWAPTDRAVAVLAAAATTGCLVAAWPLSRVALAGWRALIAAVEIWQTRWAALRFDPAPQLTATTVVGGATADTFRAPSALGSQAFLGLALKIAPSLGAGVRVAVLDVPDTDSTGASRPGTRHPLLFQVVSWPATGLPDPADPATDPAGGGPADPVGGVLDHGRQRVRPADAGVPRASHHRRPHARTRCATASPERTCRTHGSGRHRPRIRRCRGSLRPVRARLQHPTTTPDDAPPQQVDHAPGPDHQQ